MIYAAIKLVDIKEDKLIMLFGLNYPYLLK